MATLNMVQAITQTLEQEMNENKKMLIFGEDVGLNGGVFRATDGLQKKFGEDRVFDTPLAESGILGLAFGLALRNYKAVPEIQFSGFALECVDALSQIARHRNRTYGRENMPVTVRSTFGGGVGTPESHSDNIEGLFAQLPGLRVVIPSGPYDAKGLLSASLRSEDPVVFLEHLKLYRSIKEEVPEELYQIELDKANVLREGTDVTVVTYGFMVVEAKKAADELAKENISVEIIDLRTVFPYDLETILKSVKKTGRVVLVQEAQRSIGVSNQIASDIAEFAIYDLEAEIGRVAAPDSQYSFPSTEHDWLPSSKDIVEKVKEVLS